MVASGALGAAMRKMSISFWGNGHDCGNHFMHAALRHSFSLFLPNPTFKSVLYVNTAPYIQYMCVYTAFLPSVNTYHIGTPYSQIFVTCTEQTCNRSI